MIDLRSKIMGGGRWVLDFDIRTYFDFRLRHDLKGYCQVEPERGRVSP